MSQSLDLWCSECPYSSHSFFRVATKETVQEVCTACTWPTGSHLQKGQCLQEGIISCILIFGGPSLCAHALIHGFQEHMKQPLHRGHVVAHLYLIMVLLSFDMLPCRSPTGYLLPGPFHPQKYTLLDPSSLKEYVCSLPSLCQPAMSWQGLLQGCEGECAQLRAPLVDLLQQICCCSYFTVLKVTSSMRN